MVQLRVRGPELSDSNMRDERHRERRFSRRRPAAWIAPVHLPVRAHGRRRWPVHRLLARTRIRLAQFRPEPLDFGTAFLRLELGDCGLRHRIPFVRVVRLSSAGANSTIPSSGKW